MSYPIDKTFSILLALAEGPATGSEIGQQVSADTLTANYLKNSSLYLTLERMRVTKIIEPSEKTPDSTYKPFQLTQKGWKVLERSIPQLETQLQFARERINAKRYQ